MTGAVEPYRNVDLRVLVRDLLKSRRHPHPRISWALGPSSPERCSEQLLTSLAELSETEKLPVYTHIYESKAMTLIARQSHQKDEGSLINYLERVGLLTPAFEPRPQRLDVTARDRPASGGRHERPRRHDR